MAGLLEALRKQNFGKEDSLIASALMHPQEGLLKSKAWLEQQMNTAMGTPLPQDEGSMYQYAPVDLARQQAALNLAGLAETGSIPFAPTSKGGLLGTVSRMTDNALPETEFSKAHKLAQKNAALPVDQGGLGLLPDNTAMDRAAAMGFDDGYYKGMYPYDWTKEVGDYPGPEIAEISRKTEFPSFNNGERGVNIAGFVTKDTDVANRFADSGPNSKGAVYPLMINKGKTHTIDAMNNYAGDIQFGESGKEFRDIIRKGNLDSLGIINTRDEGDILTMLNDKNIRSKFAAFDPLKRNSPNILASGLLASFLMDQKNARNTD